ncbi:MAG: hypothetical protein NTY00_11000 [Deltaproteobacteria bacterium]|nr:hypothetical protein [Deltaproteobacteria bacterium]
MATRNKAEKFIELANKRVNKALKDLQLISNLSNRQNYEFTEEQAKKIVKALQQEIDIIKQNFQHTGETGRNDFRL